MKRWDEKHIAGHNCPATLPQNVARGHHSSFSLGSLLRRPIFSPSGTPLIRLISTEIHHSLHQKLAAVPKSREKSRMNQEVCRFVVLSHQKLSLPELRFEGKKNPVSLLFHTLHLNIHQILSTWPSLSFSLTQTHFTVIIHFIVYSLKGWGPIFFFIRADVRLPPCLHQSQCGCRGDGVPLLTGALRNNALLNSARGYAHTHPYTH